MSTNASASDADGEHLVGRCYTAARRYPLQVGRFSNGGRIPGGPYTMTQLAVMIGVFVVLVVTRPLWGGFGLLDALVVLVVPYAAGWGICRVQIDHRNPLAAVASLAGVALSAPAGKMHGRPVRPRPAHLVAPVVTVHVQPPAPGPAVAPAAVGVGERDSGQAAQQPAPLVSGVQTLLARAAQNGPRR